MGLEVTVVLVGSGKNGEDIFLGETEGSKCCIEFPKKGVYGVQI